MKNGVRFCLSLFFLGLVSAAAQELELNFRAQNDFDQPVVEVDEVLFDADITKWLNDFGPDLNVSFVELDRVPHLSLGLPDQISRAQKIKILKGLARMLHEGIGKATCESFQLSVFSFQ